MMTTSKARLLTMCIAFYVICSGVTFAVEEQKTYNGPIIDVQCHAMPPGGGQEFIDRMDRIWPGLDAGRCCLSSEKVIP